MEIQLRGAVTFFFKTINTDTSFIYKQLLVQIFSMWRYLYFISCWMKILTRWSWYRKWFLLISNQYIQIVENDLSIDSIKIVDEICGGSQEVLKFCSTDFLPVNYTIDSSCKYWFVWRTSSVLISLFLMI